jgi:uncharacterized protein (TIGR03435 family)
MCNKAAWGLFFLLSALCLAQKDQTPRFDAVSIRPYTGDPRAMLPFTGGPRGNDPGRVTYGQVVLRTLVADAYVVRDPRRDISGPDWIDNVWYTLTATYPPETTVEQFRQMIAACLADRFGLVIHREPTPASGYDITVGPSGLQSDRGEANADGFPLVGPGRTFVMAPGPDSIRMSFRQATMGLLANRLNALLYPQHGGSGLIGITDKTGITDKFDFHLEIQSPAGEVNISDISKALEKQLDLHLTPAKTTIDRIVIDHANKMPTPD